MSTITKIVADFQTRLSTKISIGGTSGILQSNLDADGNALPNGYYFLTLDGDNALKEYIFCQLTGNALSNIYSVSVQGVKTSGTIREHRFSCLVELTNFAQIKLLNDIWSGKDTLDATHPLTYDTTVSITDDKQIATRAYCLTKTISACVKATISALGIAKLSVAPTDSANPIAYGTNDPLIPTQDQNDAMAGTNGTPGSGNPFVTAQHSARTGNVALSGNQSIDGVKTFSSIPVMPGNPTTDNQMANLAYAQSLLLA